MVAVGLYVALQAKLGEEELASFLGGHDQPHYYRLPRPARRCRARDRPEGHIAFAPTRWPEAFVSAALSHCTDGPS